MAPQSRQQAFPSIFYKEEKQALSKQVDVDSRLQILFWGLWHLATTLRAHSFFSLKPEFLRDSYL